MGAFASYIIGYAKTNDEGEIVGELDPKTTTVKELGLYMAGAKRNVKDGE